jgi:periplasmic divalent cation tolerance protein
VKVEKTAPLASLSPLIWVIHGIRQIRAIRVVFCLRFPLKATIVKAMSDKTLVISTAGSKEEASRIANALVEAQLAACVNIVGPIESVYRWQNKVESAPEFLLLIKTTTSRSAAVFARIRELHSYDLPEAIEIRIEGGSADYLKWIADSVK